MASQMVSDLISALTALSRLRALTEEESLALERAIHAERKGATEYGPRAGGWSEEQDAIALRLRTGEAKVGEIARQLRRTPDAVYARVRYLTTVKQLSIPCVGRRG